MLKSIYKYLPYILKAIFFFWFFKQLLSTLDLSGIQIFSLTIIVTLFYLKLGDVFNKIYKINKKLKKIEELVKERNFEIKPEISPIILKTNLDKPTSFNINKDANI